MFWGPFILFWDICSVCFGAEKTLIEHCNVWTVATLFGGGSVQGIPTGGQLCYAAFTQESFEGQCELSHPTS